MCGLCGFFGAENPNPGIIQAMTRSLQHRGPDHEAHFIDGRLHFGHSRLSIIDLTGSHQPIFNEDRTLVMVYNGEIYNFHCLRRELIEKGHIFTTHGDGEVLVHAYEEYGRNMLSCLSGMFAFAIYDTHEESLFLARDHLGVKPLYYFWDGHFLAFASELKALLVHPAVKRQVDLEALTIYLHCQFIPAPLTIYRHIKKLRAAQALFFRHGHLDLFSYWEPDFVSKVEMSEAEAIARTEKELRRSVESMLIADVPLGAFVSGGVDSGLVAAMMTDGLNRPVETFTVGFNESGPVSEHLEAERLARHIGSRHNLLMFETRHVLDQVENFINYYDEPLADQAALPTFILSAFARQKVTVVLTGEGADEVFGGYNHYWKRYRDEKIASTLTFPGSPFPALAGLLPPRTRKSSIPYALTRPAPQRYLTDSVIFHELILPGYLSAGLSRTYQGLISKLAGQYYEECPAVDYRDRLLCLDTRFWLPNDLLPKVDLATMAHSLEARVPYLDHKLVEWMAGLKADYKVQGQTTKYLLKKIAEKYLPAELVYRPKHPFLIPLHKWLEKELRGLVLDNVSKTGLFKRGIFNQERLNQLLQGYVSGKKFRAPQIWALLILELWFKRYEPDFEL